MLPFNIMTVPLILEANAIKTDIWLRIDEIHEWPANTTDVAQQLLDNELDWSKHVKFEKIKSRPHFSLQMIKLEATNGTSRLSDNAALRFTLAL